MNVLALPILAVFVFAVVLRSCKRPRGIDWNSRATLLLVSTLIGLMLGVWLRAFALNAAEAGAAGGYLTHGVSVIAARYNPMLIPLYIAGMLLIIDVLSRFTRPFIARQVGDENRSATLWRSVSADLLLFVGTPGVLYAWTAKFTNSGSMVDGIARETVMPVIDAYGTPSRWLARVWRDNVGGSFVGGWNPPYIHDGALSLQRFWFDAAPWFVLAVLIGCSSTLASRTPDTRRLIEYFISPNSSFLGSPLARLVFGTWRSLLAVGFTLTWAAHVVLSQTSLRVVLGLEYIVLALLVIGIVAVPIAIALLVIYLVRARRA